MPERHPNSEMLLNSACCSTGELKGSWFRITVYRVWLTFIRYFSTLTSKVDQNILVFLCQLCRSRTRWLLNFEMPCCWPWPKYRYFRLSQPRYRCTRLLGGDSTPRWQGEQCQPGKVEPSTTSRHLSVVVCCLLQFVTDWPYWLVAWEKG